MYHVEYTNRFKKDLKRCVKRGLDIRKIYEAVKLLEEYGELPVQYSPHKLSGNMAAYSDDTRSLIPVISVHLVSNLQYRWQS